MKLSFSLFKKFLFVGFLIFGLLSFSNLVMALPGQDLINKASGVQRSFFSFVQSISWYFTGVAFILLLLLKKAGAVQGDQQKEGLAVKGLWALAGIQVSITWGQEIFDLFKGLFT